VDDYRALSPSALGVTRAHTPAAPVTDAELPWQPDPGTEGAVLLGNWAGSDHLRRADPQAVMAVLTADHYITDTSRFRQCSPLRCKLLTGLPVTLGIQPSSRPRLCYIEQGPILGEARDFSSLTSGALPKSPTARPQRAWLRGIYSWNSGMFIWQVRRILEV